MGFLWFCALNQLYPHDYEFPLQLQMCLVLNDTSTVITDNCERLVATFRSLLQRATPENPIGNTYHSLYIYSSLAEERISGGNHIVLRGIGVGSDIANRVWKVDYRDLTSN